MNFKKTKLSSPIKFKDIMQLNQYNLIFLCINAGLLKKLLIVQFIKEEAEKQVL